MTTTLGFKDQIDLPDWRPLAVSPNASAAGGSLACDLRDCEDRIPLIFQLASATVLNCYYPKNDGWSLVGSPALTGTFGAGAGAVMLPSRGPRGTIAAGATTTSVVLSTALPAAVGINQLADRGDGQGFKVRIIDNGAGGSGKIAEMFVVANTGGTTPTLILSTTAGGTPTTMGFTPVSGSAYEFLSGRVYMLSAAALVGGMWKYYDIATNSFSGNLATTNLPATVGTDAAFVALDEGYSPNDSHPGEGFVLGAATYNALCPDGVTAKRCLVATATAAGTITGQASGGDATVLANEFRNFVIRIVEDTTNVTAVGQRRRITSHTAGASAVYTVNGNWTVTPSSTCKFVIENNSEILLFGQNSTSVFCYASDTIGSAQTGDTWSTSIYGVKGGAGAAGSMAFQGFGVPTTKTYGASAVDPSRNFRWSQIFVWRGGGVVTMDVLDIAGGATGAWSNAAVYGSGPTFTTGSCGVYDPNTSAGSSGCVFYMNQSGTTAFFRFNALTRQLNAWCQLRYSQGTAVAGDRLALKTYFDGATSVTMVVAQRSSGAECFDSLIHR